MESEGIELIPGEVLNAETPDARSTYFEVSARVPGAPGTLYYAQTDDGRVAILKGPPSVGGRAPSLEREMRHLALLAPHPNVLRVLGKHKDPRGHTLLFLERLFESPFLVLNREHVRARLQERAEPKAPPKTGAVARARRLAPPVSVALELAYELALALEHLHSKGIVHGDVRPENLMLAIDWREPEIPDSQYFERIARGRWRGVLVDLGGSRTGKELEGLARGLPLVQPPKTTPLYVPPEILPGQKDATG
ncbi:protein kinase, partial [bacterium]|nr:protein kinase [bacterium]